jgi:amino acid transporter
MEKKLKLMKFWLLGVFVILAAAIFIFFWLTGQAAGAATGGVVTFLIVLKAIWWIWLLIAVLCVGLYFIYKAVVSRKKK